MLPKALPIAALVKYNPCSVHARMGSSCNLVDLSSKYVKRCHTPMGLCSDPAYDKWFREVVKGNIKCFYPRRIKLFEVSGRILVLYHSHARAIVGEAKITKATSEDGVHCYWFEDFLIYPNPVKLKLIKSDLRFGSLAKRGRWRSMYISIETLEEIRELAELKGESEERQKMERELEKLEAKKSSYRSNARYSLKSKEQLDEMIAKLSRIGIEPTVIEKTKEIFLDATGNKLVKGRRLETVLFASLYLAFRLLGIPRSVKEVRKLGGIELKEFNSVIRLLLRKLQISPKIHRISIHDWLLYYSEKLKISKETIQLSENMISKIKTQTHITGLSPLTICATIIFLASQETGENLSQSKIAKVIGVSSVAIRNLAQKWLSSIKL